MFKEYEEQKLKDFYKYYSIEYIAEMIWNDAMMKSFHVKQELIEKVNELKKENAHLKRMYKHERGFVKRYLQNKK